MMAGRGFVVLFLLDSACGNPVRYCLREDTSFEAVFWSFKAKSGNNPCLVRFLFMNSVKRCDLPPGDFGPASANVGYASTIYVL